VNLHAGQLGLESGREQNRKIKTCCEFQKEGLQKPAATSLRMSNLGLLGGDGKNYGGTDESRQESGGIAEGRIL
jgi:hypothetical protein